MQLNYTENARQVLRLAEKAAKQGGHRYIGSEHLLTALVQEPGRDGRCDPAGEPRGGAEAAGTDRRAGSTGGGRGEAFERMVAKGKEYSSGKRRNGTFF